LTGREASLREATHAEPRRMATPAEVAEYLQVPVKTLYRWRYAGEGPPAYRVGRHLRFHWSDVEGWLASRGTDHGTPRADRPERVITRRDNAAPRAGTPAASWEA
jgi:excisionase family DNA binding protein